LIYEVHNEDDYKFEIVPYGSEEDLNALNLLYKSLVDDLT